MPDIILLTGNLDYTITLDASAMLFDDRKFDLTAYFANPHDLDHPPRKYNKRDLLNSDHSFAVPFKPFLENAQPKPDATAVLVEKKNGEQTEVPLEKAKTSILAFTENGKFLKEDGPVHFYYGDASNKDRPITDIAKFIVR